jgi:hypothetical protein
LEELSQPVGSLAKSEKRYVALFCRLQGGHKAYWQLYPWLEAFEGEWGQLRQLVVGHRLSLHLELGEFAEGAALLKVYQEKEASHTGIVLSHSQGVLHFYAAAGSVQGTGSGEI